MLQIFHFADFLSLGRKNRLMTQGTKFISSTVNENILVNILLPFSLCQEKLNHGLADFLLNFWVVAIQEPHHISFPPPGVLQLRTWFRRCSFRLAGSFPFNS